MIGKAKEITKDVLLLVRPRKEGGKRNKWDLAIELTIWEKKKREIVYTITEEKGEPCLSHEGKGEKKKKTNRGGGTREICHAEDKNHQRIIP